MQVIYLFTAQHTGTHFVRMLLETHPEIAVCVDEATQCGVDEGTAQRSTERGRRVDAVAGHPRLGGALFDVCNGAPVSYLAGSIAQCLAGPGVGGSPAAADRASCLMEARRREFAEDHGIYISEKHPRYYLFHGHCGLGFAGLRVPSEILTVTSVRHPLKAILSSLKRGEPHAIADQMFAFRYLQEMPAAFKICVDLWSGKTRELLEVFNWLGLAPSSASVAFASASPKINQTLGPGMPVPHHNYAGRRNLDGELDEAAAWLEDGKLHAILRPYWEALRSEGVVKRYEALGYDFHGLGAPGSNY